jgi:hypothetical protein
MMAMVFLQMLSALGCVLAMALNTHQARRWAKRRRELDESLRPVGKVIAAPDGMQGLGIVGVGPPPPVGTFLYVLDEPAKKPPRQKVMHA